MAFLIIMLKMSLFIIFFGISASICYILVSATVFAVKKAIKEKMNESEDI